MSSPPTPAERNGSNLADELAGASATFTVPAGVDFNVEAVVATIDNSAGGATRATLTLRDSGGEVIAILEQAQAIPAGATGHATFARRLLDNGQLTGLFFDTQNTGDYLQIELTGREPFEDNSLEIVAARTLAIQTLAEIVLQSAGAAITMNGDVTVDSDGIINLRPTTDFQCLPLGKASIQSGEQISIEANTGDIALSADAGDASLFALGNFVVVTDADFRVSSGGVCNIFAHNFELKVDSGQQLTVVDHNFNPIFRVDENGDLHGKTGKALVFDL